MAQGKNQHSAGSPSEVLTKLRARFRREATRQSRFAETFTRMESRAQAYGMWCAYSQCANTIDKILSEARALPSDASKGAQTK